MSAMFLFLNEAIWGLPKYLFTFYSIKLADSIVPLKLILSPYILLDTLCKFHFNVLSAKYLTGHQYFNHNIGVCCTQANLPLKCQSGQQLTTIFATSFLIFEKNKV